MVHVAFPALMLLLPDRPAAVIFIAPATLMVPPNAALPDDPSDRLPAITVPFDPVVMLPADTFNAPVTFTRLFIVTFPKALIVALAVSIVLLPVILPADTFTAPETVTDAPNVAAPPT